MALVYTYSSIFDYKHTKLFDSNVTLNILALIKSLLSDLFIKNFRHFRIKKSLKKFYAISYTYSSSFDYKIQIFWFKIYFKHFTISKYLLSDLFIINFQHFRMKKSLKRLFAISVFLLCELSIINIQYFWFKSYFKHFSY